MTGGDDDYQFDEESGEWVPAAELAAKRAAVRQAGSLMKRLGERLEAAGGEGSVMGAARRAHGDERAGR